MERGSFDFKNSRGKSFGGSTQWNILARIRHNAVTSTPHCRSEIASLHDRWTGEAEALDCRGRSILTINEATLTSIEAEHAAGLTSVEILDLFATHGVHLSEATLRKYVQVGLLPRSVRVGRKGKHQGSQGVYPVSVVRQITEIKAMMAQHYTIEQIQREFFFMRSDLDQLSQTLSSLFASLGKVVQERRSEAQVKLVARDVSEARALGKDLVSRLENIESRLTSRARMGQVAAS